MLPNRFPDVGEQRSTTRWMQACGFLWRPINTSFTPRIRFLKETLLPAMADILDWHQSGTRYGIHMASDGLLAAGNLEVQLTWMDARIGDWVVTPRNGKAVEVNALWYKRSGHLCQLVADDRPQ